MLSAEEIICLYDMCPLPQEGGWFTESYRAAGIIPVDGLPERYSGKRNYSTAILYLLTAETCSKMHRVKSDEVFHFYQGDPVECLQIFPDGSHVILTLGNDLLNGQKPQMAVPQGTWQGCHLKEGGRWALLGCTVAPGFEFADYEHGNRDQLLSEYPDLKEILLALT